MPSMIEACLRPSETIRSCSPVIVGMTPVLAVKPLWNVRTAGVPLDAARSASRASCIAIVPEMGRTAPGAGRLVSVNCAVDGRARARSDAELADRRQDRLAQPWVVGEPQVVVGRQ